MNADQLKCDECGAATDERAGSTFGALFFCAHCASGDNPHAIAAEFTARLQAYMSESEWTDVISRVNPDADWCPSHDHCDANVFMLEAYEWVSGCSAFNAAGHMEQEAMDTMGEAWNAAQFMWIEEARA